METAVIVQTVHNASESIIQSITLLLNTSGWWHDRVIFVCIVNVILSSKTNENNSSLYFGSSKDV